MTTKTNTETIITIKARAMFTCENSDYCPNGTETFTSVNDFHAYCKACGFEPVELVGVGVDLWDTYPADHWNAGAAKEIVLRRSL